MCVLSMVIWSEFLMGQYRHEDHREEATHFMIYIKPIKDLEKS